MTPWSSAPATSGVPTFSGTGLGAGTFMGRKKSRFPRMSCLFLLLFFIYGQKNLLFLERLVLYCGVCQYFQETNWVT